MAKTIGVLGIQGAIEKHVEIIDQLGYKTALVKTQEVLSNIDALVMPGGESTSMIRQLEWYSLLEPLKKILQDGLPVFGTCAGLILLSNQIKILDISILRNAYGSQINSFKTDLQVKGIDHKVPAFFIRAPLIEKVSDDVEVLSIYNNNPVLVKQGKCMAATFHPELTNDTSIHELFVNII
ncbi:MAG: pyridoxal 5'-phosphate synthase glutaminase subunit PdxT [Bacteroidales bacterium]|jgi:5'-phosphate synthase pdxT subunit|nr:pyridoxal 5'-phosphate synthase glutaminase subunit PdxT [Bacteroidales bacterium]